MLPFRRTNTICHLHCASPSRACCISFCYPAAAAYRPRCMYVLYIYSTISAALYNLYLPVLRLYRCAVPAHARRRRLAYACAAPPPAALPAAPSFCCATTNMRPVHLPYLFHTPLCRLYRRICLPAAGGSALPAAPQRGRRAARLPAVLYRAPALRWCHVFHFFYRADGGARGHRTALVAWTMAIPRPSSLREPYYFLLLLLYLAFSPPRLAQDFIFQRVASHAALLLASFCRPCHAIFFLQRQRRCPRHCTC